MKHIISIFSFLILLTNSTFGQNKNFKQLAEIDLNFINEFSSTIKDTSFILSPLIYSNVDTAHLDITLLTNKYGFEKEQFKNSLLDTFQMNENDYFTILNPDSLIAFKNHKEPSVIFLAPLMYCIKKYYQKEAICYFKKPIVTKNKSNAIVQYWITCGNLCGWGEIVLMKRVNGKWSIIKTLVTSES
jgi:hypothetical protein